MQAVSYIDSSRVNGKPVALVQDTRTNALNLGRVEGETPTLCSNRANKYFKGESLVKRFLSVFVTSMFLASAAFAAETKEEKKTDPAKADAKADSKADSKAKAGDTKGDTKSDAKSKAGDTKGDAKSDTKGDAKSDEKKASK